MFVYRNAEQNYAGWRDWIIASALLLIAGLFLLKMTHGNAIPMEDASMLLRYSLHLSQGHGIVWNIGDHPVEGATDFLYMAMIGTISRLTHASIFIVGRMILAVSQLATVVTLYITSRKLFRAPIAVAVFISLYCAFGSAYHFIDSMFSAPFYGFVALLVWVTTQDMNSNGITAKRAIMFSLLALTLGLIRPEGNFIALFMLCAALYLCKTRRSLLIISFFGIFALLGGCYFLWRWHYFGYLLPNPFYIKRHFLPHSAIHGSRLLVELIMPAIPLLGLGVCSKSGRRALTGLAIVVIPFLAMWSTITLENNGYNRFEYVMVPVILLSASQAASIFFRDLRPVFVENLNLRRAIAGFSLIGACMAVVYLGYYDTHVEVNPGAYDLAMRLKPLAAHGDTMVATEAGTLPLYSEWREIDPVGLNDEYIAHHGSIPDEYLDRYKPDLILYMSFELGPNGPNPAPVLRSYAERRNYTLAAIYGAQYCLFSYYWVRTSSPDAATILSAIRDHPYGWEGTGAPTFDFRDADAKNTCP